MAMSWTSLTGDKNTAGSIAKWINYSLLDTNAVVDEAQSLVYLTLRTREMRTHARFTIAVGGSEIALTSLVTPGSTFLDPIGRIYVGSQNLWLGHRDEGFVQRRRIYSETTGSFGASPFTTTNGSSLVSVSLTAHAFNQDSMINIAAATAVGGLTPNGTFDITSITDANTFVIDCSILNTPASSSTTGGGSAATYTCDTLIQNSPRYWSIIDEMIKFDCAFDQQLLCELYYFRSLPLLSASNPTNFLTSRYPILMRKACMASAADFMKDDNEYQKNLAAMQALIQQIQVQDDMMFRGADIITETPGGW